MWCLVSLAWLLKNDKQLDTAEEATSRMINLLPEKGNQFLVCTSHHVLSYIYQSKGEMEKAIHQFEVALRIMSSFNWDNLLFWAHASLVGLFHNEDRFDDTQAHLEHAKSHAVNSTYFLGQAMELQAMFWHKQHRVREARSEI